MEYSSDDSERALRARRRSANLRSEAAAFLERHSERSEPTPAARTREQLHRFHREASSFLARVAGTDTAPAPAAATTPDSPAQNIASPEPPIDSERLHKFHAHAISFLDRAYASEPKSPAFTIPAGNARSASSDKEMLEKFHHEAMSFLDAAATNDQHFDDDEVAVEEEEELKDLPPDTLRSIKSKTKKSGNGYYTAMRIRRDKQRLEQHYQDAMSFLERAEAGDRRVLIEEEELAGAALEKETAAAERIQLQNYAREAMSFLDKAFRQNASFFVDDEHDEDDKSFGRRKSAASRSSRSSRSRSLRRAASREWAESPSAVEKRIAEEEDRSIAQDRAALERYEEEYADFLSKAYLDDSTVIVDDAESETSRSDRGLYARPMLPSSSASADTSYDESADLIGDDLSEEVNTDDEFQDPAVADSVKPASSRPARSPRGRSSGDYRRRSPARSVGSNSSIGYGTRRKMQMYEMEATQLIDSANVSEEETEYFENGRYQRASRSRSTSPLRRRLSPAARSPSVGSLGDDFGADQEIDDSDMADTGEFDTHKDRPTVRIDEHVKKSPKGRGQLRKLRGTAPGSTAPVLSKQDMIVDLLLEEKGGVSQQWSEVHLEKSFYRQLPRGSTVRIMPRPVQRVADESDVPEGRSKPAEVNNDVAAAFNEEIKKMASERDAVIAALEEIVNERSMLAAQVGEMKDMIAGAVGHKRGGSFDKDEDQEIDLAAELRSAYETMRTMTEETEETINVMERRREQAEREKKAIERHLEEKQKEIANLQDQLSKYAEMVANDIDERSSQSSSLGSAITKSGEYAAGSRAASAIAELRKAEVALEEAEIARSQTEERLETAKREFNSQLRAANARAERLIKEQAELEMRVTELEITRKADRQRAANAQTRLENSEHRCRQLQEALESSENKLLNEQVETESKVSAAVEQVRRDKEAEFRSLKSQIETLESDVSEITDLRVETRSQRSKIDQLSSRLQVCEAENDSLREELQKGADENRGLKAELRESLRTRAANASQTLEVSELQKALNTLREESAAKEEKLTSQMEDFKKRAERAVNAAATAEDNAKEAADAASKAQENARVQIESERRVRRALEIELNAKVAEFQEKERSFERYVQQQVEKQVAQENAANDLVKSSSKRGLKYLIKGGYEGKRKR